jgi:catechol-2,3-dioxygenase
MPRSVPGRPQGRPLRRRLIVLLSALAGLVPAGAFSQTTAPYIAQDSLNVFRRFTADSAMMLQFYGEVIGLTPLQTIGGVHRFRLGTGEVKLTASRPGTEYARGALGEVAGVQLWTFTVPDEAAVVARFTSHGYAVPRFEDKAGIRSALVQDPDGQWVQLVVAATGFDRLAVGITVADVESSRAYYRTFVGLQELPKTTVAPLAATAYPFRHGTTTINLLSFSARPRPGSKGLAGIQYVVSDVDAVDALAKSRMIPVEQPLRETLPGLRTVWLFDPDNVTNYFAETRASRGRGAGSGPTASDAR